MTSPLSKNVVSEFVKMEALLQEIPAALALLSGPEFVFEMANKEYFKLVGRSNLIGKTLIEALPEMADQVFPQILQKVYETGETFQARDVKAFLHLDPFDPHALSTVYVDVTYRRILGGENQPYAIFVFAVDVTEKVQARSIIQMERQKLEIVFANTSAAMAIVEGPLAIYERANSSYLNLFNDRPLIGKPLLEALPELADQKFPGLIAGVFATGEPYCEMEAQALLRRTHDSPLERRYFDQSYTRISGADGIQYGVLIQAVDVTERVHQREELAKRELTISRSERHFRMITEVMPQVVWTARPDGVLDFTNDRWRQYSGSEDPALWATFIHPQDVARVTEIWQKAVASGDHYEAEFRLLRKADQTYRWFLVRAQAALDLGGKIERWFGTCTDIQEQKAALAARSEFVSIASHELKTPLTSLKLQTQSMRRNFERGKVEAFSIDKVSALIKNNEKQVGRLVRLVDDMLDFAKIESGKLSMFKERTDLGELVQEVFERMLEQLEVAECESTLECTGVFFSVVDRFRIEQVVINLLTNAMRYGKGMPVAIRIAANPQEVVISVTDQGIGVAPQHQERIFKRFERAVSASDTSGLGLGLYISSQIVEAHHGRLSLESELGKGSTFTLGLPRENSNGI
jgi:PAS domain S-box-containing protein